MPGSLPANGRSWQGFWHRREYDFTALAGAVLFSWLSLTPSLLPRNWLIQGLVSGISAGIGYAIGVVVGYTVRILLRHRSYAPGPLVSRVLSAVGLVLSLVFLSLNWMWQRQLHRMMGAEDAPGLVYHLATIAVAVSVFMLIVAAARSLQQAMRAVSGVLRRWIPAPVAGITGTVLVLVVGLGILDGVVLQGLLGAADRFFRVVNHATSEGVEPPVSALMSGGPESLSPWRTLGAKGKDFVSGAPTATELEAFGGSPASEPIRVYAGLDATPDVHERAALAVKELERAGAFTRRVLCVVATTGTGWVNPAAAASLEYMYNGDTALVAMQYSYLPSWISLLVDQERGADATRELFDQVYERWSQSPDDERPLLLVYGESLGSFASESAFSGIGDLRNRVDGALWVGPLNFNPLWRDFVERRQPDTPERLPVFEEGRTVRFAAAASDLERPGPIWPSPRVVYLQHASDPVVWGSPRMVLRRPDWLAEPRGPDVLGDVRWYPFVTFWQVVADMTHAHRVPEGHGHLYGSLVVDAWAAIASPPGWTSADTARLKRHVEASIAVAG